MTVDQLIGAGLLFTLLGVNALMIAALICYERERRKAGKEMNAVKYLQTLWQKVRSNPIFVTVSGAAIGAVGSTIDDEFRSGHLDFSRSGIHKLLGYAASAAIAAYIHLYRPSPSTSNPKQ